MKSALRSIATTAAVLAAALVLTILVSGLPLAESLRLIFDGAMGSEQGLARSAIRMAPLLILSLGVIAAWRAGMYSIGGEGQFVMGGVAGAICYRALHGIPGPVLNPLILIASMVGGAAWAWIAGWLQVRRGVAVVITTILLNFVAIQVLDYAVNGPLKEPGGALPMSERLPDTVMLAHFSPQNDFHIGVIFALFLALIAGGLLFQTSFGYSLRVVGLNPRAARANQLPADRIRLIAMAISGAFCGLAGGVEYTATAGQLSRSFSQDYGFMAIPSALLGSLHPLGAILSSTYFGALFAGTENLARFQRGGTNMIYILQASAVLAIVGMSRWREARQAATRKEAE